MRKISFPLFLVLFAGLVLPLAASAQEQRFVARLRAFEEVPTLSTPGGGRLVATLNEDGTELAYELSYLNVEGTILQAHIHLGQTATNGGIMVFLCSNLGNGPAGTPLCPPDPATVTGTLTAASVVGLASSQGVGAGELFSVVRAMRAGFAYANLHSSLYTGGEIRGQVRLVVPNGKSPEGLGDEE